LEDSELGLTWLNAFEFRRVFQVLFLNFFNFRGKGLPDNTRKLNLLVVVISLESLASLLCQMSVGADFGINFVSLPFS